ncbi:hypothetical protein JR334_04305 [Clostridia bacterium]|nr:hypothetical protein JR334_04305 [Clostridia bacterium]
MNYNQLYELQCMRIRREAMEKSYPRERELKLRRRKKELLLEKKDLILLEEKLRCQMKDIHRLQDEKQTIVEEISKINEDLYSNRFTPKELTSLQNRLENLESTLANRNTRIDKENTLLMTKKADLKDKKNSLVDRMKDYEGKVEEYLQERNRLLEKLKLLDEQITEFISELDETDRAFYDKENTKYGIRMLSVLKKGRFCSNCSMLLESDTIHAVKSNQEGVRCQSCDRVLYNFEE